MLTVVFAEKEHLAGIQTYRDFLKPFLECPDLVLCEWNPDESSLEEAVPGLPDALSGQTEWRAVILCDSTAMNQKNPFDRIEFRLPERCEGESEREYRTRVQELKSQAYADAAKQPLVRLVTALCPWPTTEGGIIDMAEDPEYQIYLTENRRKRELREEIVCRQQFYFTLPEEVFCVALRSFREERYDLTRAWSSHMDVEYSDFWDTNLYFDRIRYLVFDILDQRDRDYTYDYIRFLVTLLIFSVHEMPPGCMEPNRVYRLDGESDPTALNRLLRAYDEKLGATGTRIRERIRELETKPAEHLTDAEAEAMFCTPITVPVTLVNRYNRRNLFIDASAPGLSGDCPTEEFSWWNGEHSRLRRELHQFLKQPRRSLKQASEDFQTLNQEKNPLARNLTEFQLDDVREYISANEIEMASIGTPNLGDETIYQAKLEEADQEVQHVVLTRMKRRVTLALSAGVLAALLVSFLPALIGNFGGNGGLRTLMVTLGAVVALALAGVAGLFWLRRKLVNRLKHVNDTMSGVTNSVDRAMSDFSRYLTCACSVMRGFSALDTFEIMSHSKQKETLILKKHASDIQHAREELRTTFGKFLPPEIDPVADKGSVYEYNFNRMADYTYPIPFDEIGERKIEFLQSGSYIVIPVDFIQRVTLRREELYD